LPSLKKGWVFYLQIFNTMSDTIRNIVRHKRDAGYWKSKEYVEVSDGQVKYQKYFKLSHKLSPYAKKGRYKITPDYFCGTNIRNNTYRHREEIRNANRSFKKGVRQGYKKELREQLNDYYNKQN